MNATDAPVHLEVPARCCTSEALSRIGDFLRSHPGKHPVRVKLPMIDAELDVSLFGLSIDDCADLWLGLADLGIVAR